MRLLLLSRPGCSSSSKMAVLYFLVGGCWTSIIITVNIKDTFWDNSLDSQASLAPTHVSPSVNKRTNKQTNKQWCQPLFFQRSLWISSLLQYHCNWQHITQLNTANSEEKNEGDRGMNGKSELIHDEEYFGHNKDMLPLGVTWVVVPNRPNLAKHW